MARKGLPPLPIDNVFAMRTRKGLVLLRSVQLEYLAGIEFENIRQVEQWLHAHGYLTYRKLGEIQGFDVAEIEQGLFEHTDEGEAIVL